MIISGKNWLQLSLSVVWHFKKTVLLLLLVPGVGVLEGDGDVYRPDNQNEFRNFVMKNTDGKGVHIMMADGVRDHVMVINCITGWWGKGPSHDY